MMTEKNTTPEKLRRYRARTFRTQSARKIRSIEAAIEFIQERGLITFWPIKGIDLPSLWTAVAGDRPVAEAHDDPGHVTWGWKDALLPQKRVYYGKYLRGKSTFASLDLLPYLYAISPRVADLDDFRLSYEAGNLTHEARQIGDSLLEHGPLHTIELRRRAHLSSTASKSRFDRALTDLQRGLWVLPVGVVEAGAWRYAFTYELLDRWLPQVPVRARQIHVAQAREVILSTCLRSVGVAHESALARTLSWPIAEIRNTLQRLASQRAVYEASAMGWVTDELISSPLEPRSSTSSR